MQKLWGTLMALSLLFSCKEEQKPLPAEKMTAGIEVVKEPVTYKKYGFDLNNFSVVHDTVRNGDSFGELMLRNRVEYPKIAKITESYRDTFDVRKIRVGKPYMILKSKDSLASGQVFIYENDPVNYTVIDFRDSVVAYRKQKEVKYVLREASGIIETSLSEALLDQQIDYSITHNLSEIYAWTIDFFHLSRGDKFKVIYKEKYINDSIYAGSEPIEAAYFEHNGKPLYAFAYQNEEVRNITEYFDEAANNLRRTFLRAPVEFGRISSKYNLKRRIRYYGYKVRPHKGTDYAAPIGTPILATANGTVVESTRKGGNGKYVKIKHNGTYSTQYLHMRKQKVKKGDYVRQGDVIGWIGMTGNSGGPHVCYRFWRNGVQVDPLREKLPAAEPLDESLRPSYFEFINPVKTQLDCIAFPIQPEEEIVTLN